MMMMLHVVKALGGVIDGAARIGIRSVENVGDAKSRESMAASHAEYLSPRSKCGATSTHNRQRGLTRLG
jgi:hypothetical protein